MQIRFGYDKEDNTEYAQYIDENNPMEQQPEKRPIGTLLVDFINFNLEEYRKGLLVNMSDGEKYYVNSHDFSDIERNDDGTLKEEDADCYRYAVGVLPDIMYAFMDYFLDLKYGRYYEEHWGEINRLQWEYREKICAIFELVPPEKMTADSKSEKKSRKKGRFKSGYKKYFHMEESKRWQYKLKTGEVKFSSIEEALEYELYLMAETETNLFFCHNCYRLSIGQRNQQFCDRNIEAIWGYSSIYKSRYTNQDGSFNEDENEQQMKAEQMTIKYMEWLRWPGHLDKTNVDGKDEDKKNVDETKVDETNANEKNEDKENKINFKYKLRRRKIRKQNLDISKEQMQYIQKNLKLDAVKIAKMHTNWQKRCDYQFRGMRTCAEIHKIETLYKNKNEIIAIKNKQKRTINGEISRLRNMPYLDEETSIYKLKEKNIKKEMYAIETKTIDYVEKYDNAETQEEKENICMEYKKLFDRAKKIASLKTDAEGNPLPKVKKRKIKKGVADIYHELGI